MLQHVLVVDKPLNSIFGQYILLYVSIPVATKTFWTKDIKRISKLFKKRNINHGMTIYLFFPSNNQDTRIIKLNWNKKVDQFKLNMNLLQNNQIIFQTLEKS